MKQNIIYAFDIIDYDSTSNEKLKKYIDEDGKIIFLTNKKGEVVVNINKIKDKIAELEKAIHKLNDSLKRDYTQDDIVIDATIQRFEFTYELSWKLMKAYLEYTGTLEGSNPRAAIQESFREGIITEGEIWLQMLQDRNLTSHAYDESIAMKIYNNINNEYAKLFQQLLDGIKAKIE